jgi:carbon storage regulator
MKRRAGESFTIGDEIEIEVLEVAGTRVKLGIVAPDSVAIVRKEARVTREENITAAQPVAPDALTALAHRVLRRPLSTQAITRCQIHDTPGSIGTEK